MRVAVRAPNWLGDAVMTLSAIRDLSSQVDELTVIAKKSAAPVYSEFSTLVTNSSWDGKVYSSLSPDKVILFTNSFSTAYAAKRGGVKERIGYSMHLRGFLLTRKERRDRSEHQIRQYERLIEAAGFKVSGSDPRFETFPAREIEDDYIVIAPGAKYGTAKRWNGFSDLMNLLAKAGERFVVIGLGDECRGIEIPQSDLAVNRIGKTSMEQVMSIVAHAKCVVSNDSGIAHLARAYDRPTTVLFGPTDPTATAPRGAEVIIGKAPCAPCHLRRCPIDHQCMNSIEADRVFETVARR